MAKADMTIPIGVELSVKLVVGDGVIEGELGTVVLDPGDTPEKVIAEFLFQVAEEINRQSDMARRMIAEGLMTRVEVPAGQDPRFVPGTNLERGTAEALDFMLGDRRVTGVSERIERIDLSQVELPGLSPEALALVVANAQGVHEGGMKPCRPVPYPEGELPVLTSYSCDGDGCACQPLAGPLA